MFHSLQIKGGKITHKYRNTNYYNKACIFNQHIERNSGIYKSGKKDNSDYSLIHLLPKNYINQYCFNEI
ncbi:hypothetical protein BAX96_09370 [Elizabethkingia anophelis]|nr:hypothetical protein BBD28_17075 [Elizabethkingia anophelis]KUY14737.1 hypothetical protein ATB94_07855 [Elizabethkingia anophelis]MDV3535453.1 hypothetical protein [Elizabethkingia anophelis]MDV3555119.1 hypothetical protein [Elizabethkingia anophelis]MDV3585093.1 hypothetical protein [Elizabethkingia anophelis]